MKSYKNKIFRVIQIGNKEDTISRAFDIFIAAVIIINIVLMTLMTFQELAAVFPLLHVVEIVTIVIFGVEYILRIWTSDILYPEYTKGKAILKFLCSFDGIVDLLTILPFFFLSGFIAFRMLRVVRIFHLFRINSQYDSFNVIKKVLYDKKNQILTSLFILLILMLASSIGIYAAEHDAQPDAYANAFSGIWWSVSALLTVGYGDIYPITVMGKFMAILTAFMGVGVVAIPTGIISAGFVEQYTKAKNLSDTVHKKAIHFITMAITGEHDWKDVPVGEVDLPKGMKIALICRGEDVIAPREDKIIRVGDRVVLTSEDYDDKGELEFTEIQVGKEHPYQGKALKDLDISRLTTIVTIVRGNKTIIPDGGTVIEANDCLTVYTKS